MYKRQACGCPKEGAPFEPPKTDDGLIPFTLEPDAEFPPNISLGFKVPAALLVAPPSNPPKWIFGTVDGVNELFVLKDVFCDCCDKLVLDPPNMVVAPGLLFILNTEPDVGLLPVKLKLEGALIFCAPIESGLLKRPVLFDGAADVKGLGPAVLLLPKLKED